MADAGGNVLPKISLFLCIFFNSDKLFIRYFDAKNRKGQRVILNMRKSFYRLLLLSILACAASWQVVVLLLIMIVAA